MKILLAEDDAQTARFISSGLEEEGHTVGHVFEGRDALNWTMYNDGDVIVLDRMMPGMDEISVIRAVRAAGKATRVLMPTALGDLDHRVEGLKTRRTCRN